MPSSPIKASLQEGTGINAKDTDGLTALPVAVRNKSKEFAGYLIATGANMNAKNNQGQPALDIAVSGQASRGRAGRAKDHWVQVLSARLGLPENRKI